MTHHNSHNDRRCLILLGPPLAAVRNCGWDWTQVEALPDPRSTTPAGGLVLLHEPTLRQCGLWAALPGWLQSMRTQGTLVLLAHGDLAASELASCFRAGLHDAIAVTAPVEQWRQILDLAATRQEILDAGRVIQADSALTQRQLQDNQRRLRDEAAAEASSLLEAQGQLSRAHGQLRDHMAQVSLLYKFGRELSLASNWDDTLREILAHLADFVGAAGGALVLQAASGGRFAPRQTYRWQEQSWDKVLLRITRQIDTGVASSLLAPGVFQVGRHDAGDQGRITALPLEHQGVRLGILLLLFANPAERQQRSAQHLPFLQMVQVVLSEEIASAQMLDRLRDIGAFNTRVLETVSSGIWVCDAQGSTIFVNRAARLMLGLKAGASRQDEGISQAVGRGRLLERPLAGGAEIDDLPEIFRDGKLCLGDTRIQGFAGLVRRKRPFRSEGLLTDTLGQDIPVRVQTAPMAGRSHDEQWLLVILEDLREARRAAAARQRAEQAEALVAMSATLAHEIRNPLMGLSAQAELLRDSLPEGDAGRRRIDLITAEVERIDCTITDMLQFVRPCEVRREPVDLARLARDCLELAAPRAAARTIELTLDAGADVCISADATKIKQVILNLVLNAVDAASEGGSVTLRLDGSSSVAVSDATRGTLQTVPGLVLCVEDDGPGFGDIDPERIFQPFFTTKSMGTGLGLAYCRKVVDAHGGDIRALRDGAVTRLQVLLPREATAGKTLVGEAS